MKINERIRNLREDADLTQSTLCKELHIAQRTYSHYETGDQGVPLEILIKIADYHDVSLDYLVGRSNKKDRL